MSWRFLGVWVFCDCALFWVLMVGALFGVGVLGCGFWVLAGLADFDLWRFGFEFGGCFVLMRWWLDWRWCVG